MYGCWLHQCIIVNFACVQLWIMQPQANAVSYGALYICRSLSAAAFHNPPSFCGEAQEDPRERNYCCSRNLVRPLCLRMVSEDRFISLRLNRWEERTHIHSRTYPGIVRTHTERGPPLLFSGFSGTDRQFILGIPWFRERRIEQEEDKLRDRFRNEVYKVMKLNVRRNYIFI